MGFNDNPEGNDIEEFLKRPKAKSNLDDEMWEIRDEWEDETWNCWRFLPKHLTVIDAKYVIHVLSNKNVDCQATNIIAYL